MIDSDQLKAYNDSRGHAAGDALLQHFAVAATASLRQNDVVARWGGDEFAVALLNTPRTSPQRPEPHSRLRSRTGDLLGYAAQLPNETVKVAMNRADDALYAAKAAGRDQLSFKQAPDRCAVAKHLCA